MSVYKARVWDTIPDLVKDGHHVGAKKFFMRGIVGKADFMPVSMPDLVRDGHHVGAKKFFMRGIRGKAKVKEQKFYIRGIPKNRFIQWFD